MGVILLNPTEKFVTADGREIGPLRCTQPAAMDLFRAFCAMEELTNAEYATVDEALAACLDIMRDALFRMGIELNPLGGLNGQ